MAPITSQPPPALVRQYSPAIDRLLAQESAIEAALLELRPAVEAGGIGVCLEAEALRHLEAVKQMRKAIEQEVGL